MDGKPGSNGLTRISTATMIILGVGWFGAQVFWAFHAGSMPLFLKGFTDSKFTISLVLSLAEFVGIGLVSMASGQICGPLIGGRVIDTLGYRWLFPCAALFLVVGLILLQFVSVPADSADAPGSSSE
jgi:predicted MFS family arabinose efflux permease